MTISRSSDTQDRSGTDRLGQDEAGQGELVDVIGEAGLIALAEAFGGRRLYVPLRVNDRHPITVAIGVEATQRLCHHFAASIIRVPLARELRAARYRSEGLSNARIAARLGLTEGGVRSLFKRLENRS